MMEDERKKLAERFTPQTLDVLTADPQVLSARFSPCGDFLLAGSFDGGVRLWDLRHKPPTECAPFLQHHGWVQGLALPREGDTVFTADSWGRMCAWRYNGEQRDPDWTVDDAHDGWIRELDVSPDGRLLASCGRDQSVRLWNCADGARLHQWDQLGGDVFCVRFHPSGKWLLSGDQWGVVKQWDVTSGECVREFDARSLYLYDRIQEVGGVRALALDQDGTSLGCGGTRPKNGATVQGVPTILVFDFDSGELRQTFELGAANDCFVHEVMFHEAGFVMAVTSGTPGTGKLVLQRLGDTEPFFVSKDLINCHSLSWDATRCRLAVTTTNRGSNGNGRRLNKDGQYEGNRTPIHILQWPA